jgi:hypothetical protein
MKKKFHIIILLTIAMGNYVVVFSQTDCAQTLLSAERAYYTGRFNEVKAILDGCITSGFDKEQKTEAYRLIALSNIFSRNFEQADSAMLLMFKTNPQYVFTAQDPPEFKKRLEQFNVHPLIEASLNLGLIQPFFYISNVHNARAIPATVTYQGNVGAQVGVNITYYLTKRISLRGGYEWQRYSFEIENRDSLGVSRLTEKQKRTQFQLSAGYSFNLVKLNLQAYAGFVVSSLQASDAYLLLDRYNATDAVAYGYSNLQHRTATEVRPLVELKLNLPQRNKWLVSLSMRYEHGLNNITNASNRYQDLYTASTLEWVEDDFTGRNLVVQLGVAKLFYRVKLK